MFVEIQLRYHKLHDQDLCALASHRIAVIPWFALPSKNSSVLFGSRYSAIRAAQPCVLALGIAPRDAWTHTHTEKKRERHTEHSNPQVANHKASDCESLLWHGTV